MGESPASPLEEPALSVRAIVIGAIVLLFAAVLASLTWVNAAAISEEEIAKRCAEAIPRWDNYQEDIKGMIGARPAAEWHGMPIAAQVRDNRLLLHFGLQGPWALRSAAMPLLVKDPAGDIRVARGATTNGDSTYTLEVSTGAPWVEVQYPHHRERFNFSASGDWSATRPPQ